MNEPKRRGRPPKVRPIEVVSGEAETPTTLVRPELDPEHDPNPIRPVEVSDVYEEVVAAELRSDEADASLSAAQVVALDRDFDGQAGGSRPKASLTELQVSATVADAIDAYEGQWEIKRTDGFNRTWTLRHEIVKNHDFMLIRVQRGPTIGERLIPSSAFGGVAAEEAVRAIDLETMQ